MAVRVSDVALTDSDMLWLEPLGHRMLRTLERIELEPALLDEVLLREEWRVGNFATA